MSRNAKPGRTVASKVPQDVWQALEDTRWEQRLPMATLISTILTEWATDAGLVDETPADADNA